MTDMTLVAWNAKEEIAKKMLAKNKPVEEIADFTGIPLYMVRELKEQILQ